MAPRFPTPPRHLTEPRKRLWRDVLAEYDLDPPGLELLRLACEALDRTEQARQAIKKDGAYVKAKTGRVYAHPALGVERDARIAAARLFRELDLEGDPLPAPRRRR